MKRIRWGNVAIATVVVLLVGYAGLALLGIAPTPIRQSEADDAAISAPTEAPVVAAAQATEGPILEPTTAPAPTALVLNLAPAPTAEPTVVADDGGFQSEVPVPQS